MKKKNELKTNVRGRDQQIGITLIALIITIIVMLILVGVVITVAIRGDLFSTARKAVADTEKEKQKELDIAINAEEMIDRAISNGLGEIIEKKIEKQASEARKVYAIVYSDGTMEFNSTGNADTSKEVKLKTDNIASKLFKSVNEVPWKDYAGTITEVKITSKIEPDTTQRWFQDFTNLTTITNINNLDTSNVLAMGQMFYGCESLTSLDLSSFDTGKVMNMKSLFCGAKI